MSIVAILGVQGAVKGQRTFNIGVLDNFKTAVCRTMTESMLVAELLRGKHRVVNAKVVNGNIEDSFGSFSRFEAKNGVTPIILVATCLNSLKQTAGYVVITQSGTVSRVRRADLIESCKKSKDCGVPFIQNAVFRDMGNDTYHIAGYEEGQIPTINISQRQSSPVIPSSAQQEKQIIRRDVEPAKKAKGIVHKEEPVVKSVQLTMSPAQNKELERAKKLGVNPLLINSPKLPPEKQRVISAAKKNGICAEYFTNPKFTREQMIFFADRLESPERFNECLEFVDPKYSVEQMQQLYLAMCAGVDIKDMLDETLTPEEMYVKRIEAENGIYDREALICSLPDEACVRNFLRRRGLLDEQTKEAAFEPTLKA